MELNLKISKQNIFRNHLKLILCFYNTIYVKFFKILKYSIELHYYNLPYVLDCGYIKWNIRVQKINFMLSGIFQK